MLNFDKIFQSPGFHIGFISQALRNNIAKRFAENGYDISFAQWPMLVALWHHGEISQKKINELIRKDKTSVARMLFVMEKHKLIERKLDPDDRRNKLINLTEKGKELVKRLVPIVEEFVDDMCKGLTNDEIESLKSTLGKIFKNIEGINLSDSGVLTKEKLFIINSEIIT